MYVGGRHPDLRNLRLRDQGRGGLGLHGLHGLFHQTLTMVLVNLAPAKAASDMDSLDTIVMVCYRAHSLCLKTICLSWQGSA